MNGGNNSPVLRENGQAVYTGLRVSELIGLRWSDIHEHSITIDERYCRCDLGEPKSDASNTTIPVNRKVIKRIQRLRTLTVEVKAGTATRRYRVVKSDGPDDLVFLSIKSGRPMRDNNILSRHIKPAARKLGIPWVNWQVLRRSYATGYGWWGPIRGIGNRSCGIPVSRRAGFAGVATAGSR